MTRKPFVLLKGLIHTNIGRQVQMGVVGYQYTLCTKKKKDVVHRVHLSRGCPEWREAPI